MELTRELKRRRPFLAHLPLACEVSFVELDLSRVAAAKPLAPDHRAEVRGR